MGYLVIRNPIKTSEVYDAKAYPSKLLSFAIIFVLLNNDFRIADSQGFFTILCRNLNIPTKTTFENDFSGNGENRTPVQRIYSNPVNEYVIPQVFVVILHHV